MSDNITLPSEAVEQALEVLEVSVDWCSSRVLRKRIGEAITILRTALAAEQPKPVTLSRVALAWSNRKGTKFVGNGEKWKHEDCVVPLYTAARVDEPSEDIEALRRDAERWRHWRDSHGFATIDHEGGRCFVTLICDCDDPDQVRAKRFKGEDSFEWLDAFTDAAMKEGT